MSYYHDLITEKSWQLLQELKRQYQFILIGGWAVYLYTNGLKSRDIDIIVNYEQLEILKNNFELRKNDRLKKYEIQAQEIDIDIYMPFFSDLGIPVEEIGKMTQNIAGFILPKAEILLILKQKAFNERQHSLKGEKDKIDIVALLQSSIHIPKYEKLLEKYKFQDYKSKLWQLVNTIVEVPELNINKHQYARFKNKLKESLM